MIDRTKALVRVDKVGTVARAANAAPMARALPKVGRVAKVAGHVRHALRMDSAPNAQIAGPVVRREVRVRHHLPRLILWMTSWPTSTPRTMVPMTARILPDPRASKAADSKVGQRVRAADVGGDVDAAADPVVARVAAKAVVRVAADPGPRIRARRDASLSVVNRYRLGT